MATLCLYYRIFENPEFYYSQVTYEGGGGMDV
jgi:hypothetical protein